MNNFGVKTISKEDRSYLAKKTKTDLINEALSLNIMIDEKLTKQQILNQIKKYKRNLNPKPKKETQINMQDLFESLPVVYPKPTYNYSKIRESDLYYPQSKSYRFPPGSKIIRKEEGLTKTQKTAIRKEIKNEIDKLSDLLEQF